MVDRDPTSYPLLTYAWVLGLSALGGFVSFMNKLKAGKTRAFNIAEFMGEIATSAFTGVITFWLCENAQFSPLITAALVGVSGHMGSRAIMLFEDFLAKKFTE
ncbi:LydA-like holin [uncultured Caudovirales phage]|uniref:LydA-like holin n=1 Tax=uncultured Caudovirales phage TaxID=2100421 RepID=A0A6J7VSV2_9CAUD|nr:LydA-like holin [uncultured Caudovirales phage]